jgi:hypothetical protein
MAATTFDVQLSRVLLLHDELDGLGEPRQRRREWDGYDHRVYLVSSATTAELDKQTARLCQRLSELGEEAIKTKSLELQLWWRDHQEFDALRQKADRERERKEALRKSAMAKLSPEELEALND